MSLAPGEYRYNFNQTGGTYVPNLSYEDGSELSSCADGNYGNDRLLTVPNTEYILPVTCWELCDICPEIVYGCTNPNAYNYNNKYHTNTYTEHRINPALTLQF